MLLARLLRAGLAAGFVGLATIAADLPRAEAHEPATLTISGTAEIAARPDRANVTSGVVTQAETAREALDLNSAALARVIAALKEAGIEERDIATSGFSVEPRYHYPRTRDGQEGPPRIVGYQVANQVTVRVRDLDRLGAVLDEAVTVGANRIHGIGFEVSDADRRLDEARAEAVRDARRKAEIYAEAADIRLLRIVSITEHAVDAPPPRPLAARAMMDAEAAVPIETGEQTLSLRVDVTWEIGA